MKHATKTALSLHELNIQVGEKIFGFIKHDFTYTPCIHGGTYTCKRCHTSFGKPPYGKEGLPNFCHGKLMKGWSGEAEPAREVIAEILKYSNLGMTTFKLETLDEGRTWSAHFGGPGRSAGAQGFGRPEEAICVAALEAIEVYSDIEEGSKRKRKR